MPVSRRRVFASVSPEAFAIHAFYSLSLVPSFFEIISQPVPSVVFFVPIILAVNTAKSFPT